ncbi:putative membrane protein [Silvibacterium bohemicum]|uniref:Putative membrane protein n=1 Tax=Silvibacterium bohemicum TaxID=1577686 RepID=A0A841JVB8_9BACT|nr:DoxX family membrane protein [Silvibacterium bohemicum]MBB6142378.1 putative membrane protein [Silvibacterium bohemicum]
MHYAVPIFVVALTIPAFFLLARGGFVAFGWPQRGIRILVAVILLASAIGHFLQPAFVAALIPPVFPFRYALAIVSGICEAAGGIGLLLASTRRIASLWLAVFMIAIFPANIYIAGKMIGPLHMPSVAVRGLMQIVFVALILLGGWGAPIIRKKTTA